jgi:hypothetical protein
MAMKRTSTAKTLAASEDEAPALSQANFDRARFRVGTQRRAVEGEHFVQDVRYAIREELAAYAIEKQ